MKKYTLMLTLFVAVLALIGCTAVTDTGSSNGADADIPTGAELQVTRARQQLAAELNIDLSGVTVVKATAVEWNDSSLGCPEPDMMYLMVVSPGYHIILEANGERYEYHTDQNETVVLCPADRSELKNGDQGETEPSAEIPVGAAELAAQVRQDLAAKLGISLNDVLVAQATAVEWSDSSLGCPQADMMYLTVITPGYRILLEAQGEKYSYHTDEGDSFILCKDDPADKISAEATEMAEKARKDLAAELGIPVDKVIVLQATAVEWGDSSLGCPEPDTMYLTVITPGYYILLEADGGKHSYHTDENELVILCSAERSLLETGDKDNMDGSFAPGAEALTAAVKRDLAAQLEIDLNRVTVIAATAVEWNDSSLGCPEPDMMYLTVITPGYRIILEANGEKYNYHTNKDGYFVLCPADRSEAGGAVEQ